MPSYILLMDFAREPCLGIADILGWVYLLGNILVQHKIFNYIPGLYTLVASSPSLPSMKIKISQDIVRCLQGARWCQLTIIALTSLQNSASSK